VRKLVSKAETLFPVLSCSYCKGGVAVLFAVGVNRAVWCCAFTNFPHTKIGVGAGAVQNACTIGFFVRTFDSSFYKYIKILRVLNDQRETVSSAKKILPRVVSPWSGQQALVRRRQIHHGLDEVYNDNSFPSALGPQGIVEKKVAELIPSHHSTSCSFHRCRVSTTPPNT